MKKKIIFILLSLLWSINLWAKFVFLGKACRTANPIKIPIDNETTVEDFETLVQEAGFDPQTLNNCHGNVNITKATKSSYLMPELNVKFFNAFSAKELADEVIDKSNSPHHKLLSYSFDNNIQGLMDLLELFNTSLEKRDFIAQCKSVEDHDKIALYYAARKGNLEIIMTIKKSIGDDHFTSLASILDNEGRTLLMAAAQASSNRVEIIELIKQYTPIGLIKAKDENGCTAYDWALLRKHKDDSTLRALAETRDSSKDSATSSSAQDHDLPPDQIGEDCLHGRQ